VADNIPFDYDCVAVGHLVQETARHTGYHVLEFKRGGNIRRQALILKHAQPPAACIFILEVWNTISKPTQGNVA
jgi:hypothetical protein